MRLVPLYLAYWTNQIIACGLLLLVFAIIGPPEQVWAMAWWVIRFALVSSAILPVVLGIYVRVRR